MSAAHVADHHALVSLYADESCLGNGRAGATPGGAGALLKFEREGGEVVRRDLWVAEPDTTNNRMALRSVIDSFRALHAKGACFRIVFTSDSRYLIDGMNDWVHGWARRGWVRKGGAIENLAFWHDAIAAVNGSAVEWRWVRGHDGHTQNEYVNFLATRAAREQTRSAGWIDSGFDLWLEEECNARLLTTGPAAFPRTFSAARALPAVPAARQ